MDEEHKDVGVDAEQQPEITVRAEIELDWEALAVAFENQLPESHSFLDLRDGSVHTVVSENHRPPPPPEPAESHLHIRPRPSREGYRTMQRFIEMVEDPVLREQLSSALVGKGAFRRFKDHLLAYPEVRQQWFSFKDAEVYAYIWNWLSREGIRPTNEPPASSSKERIAASVGPAPPRREPVADYEPSREQGPWREAIARWDRPDTVFRPARAALLVIDMQKVFADPAGGSYLPMSAPAGERLAELITACRAARVPVMYTRHVHQRPEQDGGAMARWWRGLILEGSPESELVDRLQPGPQDRVITKCRYSAFAGTPLELVLRSMGIEDLLIGGVMTNLCCETTARDAFVRDFNVFFLADATATVDEALHLSSLRNIAYGFGRVLGAAEALAILNGASNPVNRGR